MNNGYVCEKIILWCYCGDGIRRVVVGSCGFKGFLGLIFFFFEIMSYEWVFFKFLKIEGLNFKFL